MLPDANIAAIILSGVALIYFLQLGFRAASRSGGFLGFFLAGRTLTRSALSDTTAAAGLSNATVAIAYLLIFPSFGLWTLIAFAANLLGQILFIYLVKNSSWSLDNVTTLGELAFDLSGSARLRSLLDWVTFASFLAALVVELIIGAQLFVYISAGTIGGQYIGFVVVSAIVLLYIAAGGLTATVRSDSWQFRLIVAAAISLVILSITILLDRPSIEGVRAEFYWGGAAPPATIFLWALNTVLLSVLSPIGQLSAWQRTSATRPEDRVPGLKVGLAKLAALWAAFALAGFAFAYSGIPVGVWDDVFAVMRSYSGLFEQALFPVLFTGLLAAMISTADSNALATVFSRMSGKIRSDKEIGRFHTVLWLVVVFGISFALFYVFNRFGQPQSFLSLIFSLFGLYLIMVPIVWSALRGKTTVRSEPILFWSHLLGAVILLVFAIPGFLSGMLALTLAANLAGFLIVLAGTMTGLEGAQHD